ERGADQRRRRTGCRRAAPAAARRRPDARRRRHGDVDGVRRRRLAARRGTPQRRDRRDGAGPRGPGRPGGADRGTRAAGRPSGPGLRELGVPPIVLAPSPPELSEAAREMVCGPSAVLTALRAARGWADGADGLLAARGRLAPAAWPPRLRNLLVYGPIALVVPLLQVVLYVTTGTGPASVFALLCGLPMPAVAFVAGWIGVGRIFGRPPEPAHATASNPAAGDPAVAAGGGTGAVPPVGPGGMPASGGRLDRTARWGALVCLVPAVLTTAGIVLAMLAG
ncbi:LOW QUALITY PROTEIN: hypothetical protein MCAG_02429, partial [Micromonospora sp. ATCC 39149]